MKKYEKPMLSILNLTVEDIMLGSYDELPDDNLNGTDNKGLYEEEDGFYTPIY